MNVAAWRGSLPYLCTQTVHHTSKITKSTASSGEACSRTLRRRSSELNKHRQVASSVAQMGHEFKALKPEDRHKLFQDMEFKIEIPPLAGIALKALPWNTMRVMRR